MENKQIFRLVLIAILAALSTVLGIFVRVPGPAGYFTLLDAGIITTSMILGNREGAAVGAIGAFLNDLLTGYPNYMFFSFVIHGLQGYTANRTASKLFNYLISGLIMVGGYFLTDWILYQNLGTPIADLFGNVVQHTAGFLIALIISQLLKKSGILHGLK